MKNALGILVAAAVALSVAACSNASGGSTATTTTTTNVGKVLKGNLYIDNVRFLDSSGDVLGTFDSFENFSGSNILCGGSSVDVWQDLKAADSAWGGQGATPASSTLHVTNGSYSMVIPVDMTISSTEANNFQWFGVNWSNYASTSTGGILLPSALAAALASTAAASLEFDYYWVPDSSSTVSSTTDLQVKSSVEWNNAAWTISDTYQGSYTNSQGSSTSLSVSASGSKTITLDYPVAAGTNQCWEIGLGLHYVGSLD